MNFLEIVLLCVCFLYAVVLHRALINIEVNDKKVEVIYRELLEHINELGHRHNALVDGQKDIFDDVLVEINKELERANNKHVENHKSFLIELEQVKRFLTQGFLRR